VEPLVVLNVPEAASTRQMNCTASPSGSVARASKCTVSPGSTARVRLPIELSKPTGSMLGGWLEERKSKRLNDGVPALVTPG
jgi:hypothetical protein